MDLREDIIDPDIDPADFLGKQDALFGRPPRKDGDLEDWYEDFCWSCKRVMDMPDGKGLLKGLKRVSEYGSTVFRKEDNFNTHSAAARDGAHGLVTEIEIGAKVAVKLQRKTLQP